MKTLFLILFITVCVQTMFAQKTVETPKSFSGIKLETDASDLLTGIWTLVSVENILPDNTRTRPYGKSPKGILIFDRDGNYAIQILREDRPKFASGDKTRGTNEENRALVLGSNSHFGKYVVNAADRTITFKVEHASFPNWEGAEQIRPFSLSNSEFRYFVPNTTNGAGVTGEVIWKRSR